MIVDKNGRVVANVSQPKIIFETESDYNSWKANLPKPDEDEKNFNVIKKFSDVSVATLSDLKAIATGDRKENITYHVDHLCGTLKQNVDYKYNASNNIFIPTTPKILMDGENYNAFMGLITANEFGYYNLDFKLYTHYLEFKIDFTSDEGSLPFKTGDILYIEIKVDLPYKEQITSVNDFISKLSNIYLRGNGDPPSMAAYDCLAHICGSNIISETGKTGIKDYVNIYTTIGGLPDDVQPWGARLSIEDYLVLYMRPTTTIYDPTVNILDCANVTVRRDYVPLLGLIYNF